MDRRKFLRGSAAVVSTAAIAPLLPAGAEKSLFAGRHTAPLLEMERLLLEQAHKIVNPPLVIVGESIDSLFIKQYGKEFVYEVTHPPLLRKFVNG